jgi:hypothetical protein
LFKEQFEERVSREKSKWEKQQELLVSDKEKKQPEERSSNILQSIESLYQHITDCPSLRSFANDQDFASEGFNQGQFIDILTVFNEQLTQYKIKVDNVLVEVMTSELINFESINHLKNLKAGLDDKFNRCLLMISSCLDKSYENYRDLFLRYKAVELSRKELKSLLLVFFKEILNALPPSFYTENQSHFIERYQFADEQKQIDHAELIEEKSLEPEKEGNDKPKSDREGERKNGHLKNNETGLYKFELKDALARYKKNKGFFDIFSRNELMEQLEQFLNRPTLSELTDATLIPFQRFLDFLAENGKSHLVGNALEKNKEKALFSKWHPAPSLPVEMWQSIFNFCKQEDYPTINATCTFFHSMMQERFKSLAKNANVKFKLLSSISSSHNHSGHMITWLPNGHVAVVWLRPNETLMMWAKVVIYNEKMQEIRSKFFNNDVTSFYSLQDGHLVIGVTDQFDNETFYKFSAATGKTQELKSDPYNQNLFCNHINLTKNESHLLPNGTFMRYTHQPASNPSGNEEYVIDFYKNENRVNTMTVTLNKNAQTVLINGSEMPLTDINEKDTLLGARLIPVSENYVLLELGYNSNDFLGRVLEYQLYSLKLPPVLHLQSDVSSEHGLDFKK